MATPFVRFLGGESPAPLRQDAKILIECAEHPNAPFDGKAFAAPRDPYVLPFGVGSHMFAVR